VKGAWRRKAATEGLEFAGVEEEALILGLTPASIQGLEDGGVTVALVTNLGVAGMVAVTTVLVEVAEVGVGGLAEVALAAMVVTRATGARANLVLATTVVPMATTEVLEAAVGTTAPTVGSQLTRRISRCPIHGYIDPAGGQHQQQAPTPAQAAAAVDQPTAGHLQ